MVSSKDRPDYVLSTQLLEYAASIIEEAKLPSSTYSLGGGTVLSYVFNHRKSKDIDIFINDHQYMGALSPRFNERSERALSYNEDGHCITLSFDEGKIDFISSTQITDFPAKTQTIFGHRIAVDDPVEIVCKKIYFRGDRAYPRDIFDLSVLYESNRREDLITAMARYPDKINQFVSKFKKDRLNPNIEPYSATYSGSLLPDGEKFIGKEFSICEKFIQEVEQKCEQSILLKPKRRPVMRKKNTSKDQQHGR